MLEDQTENEKLKEILAEVRQDIEAGISMSDALEKHPDTFNDLYVAMTRTGETAGMLEESLDADRRPAGEAGLAAAPGAGRRWPTR